MKTNLWISLTAVAVITVAFLLYWFNPRVKAIRFLKSQGLDVTEKNIEWAKAGGPA